VLPIRARRGDQGLLPFVHWTARKEYRTFNTARLSGPSALDGGCRGRGQPPPVTFRPTDEGIRSAAGSLRGRHRAGSPAGLLGPQDRGQNRRPTIWRVPASRSPSSPRPRPDRTPRGFLGRPDNGFMQISWFPAVKATYIRSLGATWHALWATVSAYTCRRCVGPAAGPFSPKEGGHFRFPKTGRPSGIFPALSRGLGPRRDPRWTTSRRWP